VLRWRNGHLEYRTRRSWAPSRTLRFCCRIGLHFMAWDFQRDGCFCECGAHFLHAERIRSSWNSPGGTVPLVNPEEAA